MYAILVFLAFSVLSVIGSGELTFLHHPKSITFKGHDHIKESLLKEVYSAALGFSIEQDSNWQGMYLKDPFNLAEGIVTVAVDGVSDLGQGKGHHFPLRTDEDEEEIFNSLKRRIEEHNYGDLSQTVRVELAAGLEELQNYELFQDIKDVKPQPSKYGYLKGGVDEEFLNEVALLNAITERVESGIITPDFNPDLFWFKVSSLHAISDIYGENATATKEAKEILSDSIKRLNDAFAKAYKGRVLVNIIASDASHTRRARAAEEPKDPAEESARKLNLAGNYNRDYPAVFNIILWLGVTMFFALLAICIFIASMDPGRDSIIYRMTSTRMKKDN